MLTDFLQNMSTPSSVLALKLASLDMESSPPATPTKSTPPSRRRSAPPTCSVPPPPPPELPIVPLTATPIAKDKVPQQKVDEQGQSKKHERGVGLKRNRRFFKSKKTKHRNGGRGGRGGRGSRRGGRGRGIRGGRGKGRTGAKFDVATFSIQYVRSMSVHK